jgi:hypothetical protein
MRYEVLYGENFILERWKIMNIFTLVVWSVKYLIVSEPVSICVDLITNI